MRVIVGNIWDYFGEYSSIVIPTNGSIKRNGAAVMGKGLALQARERFKGIDKILGGLLQSYGEIPFLLPYNLISFPTKWEWYEKADLKLIAASANILAGMISIYKLGLIYMPKIGCGNGGLLWEEVEPILEKLNRSVIIVDLK